MQVRKEYRTETSQNAYYEVSQNIIRQKDREKKTNPQSYTNKYKKLFTRIAKQKPKEIHTSQNVESEYEEFREKNVCNKLGSRLFQTMNLCWKDPRNLSNKLLGQGNSLN
jgi:diphthamide synthase (EF-2-diphthine--ammonia ligase)